MINARRHLAVADLLATKRHYGPASSHVVLALEELSKSLLITQMTMGIDIPKKFQREVLQQHSSRQSMAFGLLFSTVIRRLVFNGMSRAIHSHSISEDEIAKQIRREVKSKTSRASGKNIYTMSLEWVLDANDLKNLGFYVDFNGQEWTHPGKVTKNNFDLGYGIAEEVIREKGRLASRILNTGYQADESLKSLMQEILAKPPTQNREQFLKEIVALVLKPVN